MSEDGQHVSMDMLHTLLDQFRVCTALHEQLVSATMLLIENDDRRAMLAALTLYITALDRQIDALEEAVSQR